MPHSVKEVLIFKGSKQNLDKLWNDLYQQPQKLFEDKQWLIKDCKKKVALIKNQMLNNKTPTITPKEERSIYHFANELNCGFIPYFFPYNKLTNKEKDFIISVIKQNNFLPNIINLENIPQFLKNNWDKIISARKWSDEWNDLARYLFGCSFGSVPVANFGAEIVGKQLSIYPQIIKKDNEIKIIQEFNSFYDEIKLLPLLIERYQLDSIEQQNYSWDWGSITQIKYLPNFKINKNEEVINPSIIAQKYHTNENKITDLQLEKYAQSCFDKWSENNKINLSGLK